MESVRNYAKARRVKGDALDAEGSWDALLFVRGSFRPLLLGASQRRLAHCAEIFEGLRTPPDIGETSNKFQFRPGNVQPFEVVPTAPQWNARSSDNRMAVKLGDIIVKRLAPVTAALIPPGIPSLPPDANFLIIRGLIESEAWWLTFTFNHPACGDYLLSKSGRGVLSRVSLSVLRDWPVDEPASDFSPLAHRLGELHQKRTFLAGRLAALAAEVETVVAEQMATTHYEETEARFAQTSWSLFVPAAVTDTSWLPAHVASEYRAAVLRSDKEWLPLVAHLLPETGPRDRFSKIDTPIRVLRLSDVSAVPLIPASLKTSIPAQATRVFRTPVQPDEVLLSMLASSPRVAFVFAVQDPPIYAVDHWERLRFRSHAAAFALILQTDAVARQLRSLATGSVQQFVRPQDVQRLFLPVIPEKTLADWDRSFRSLCRSWHQTDSEWHAAIQEGKQAVRRAYHLTNSDPSPPAS